MKELVETLVKALVKNPDAVSITVVEKGSLEIYQVHVAPEDMGKVIGRIMPFGQWDVYYNFHPDEGK